MGDGRLRGQSGARRHDPVMGRGGLAANAGLAASALLLAASLGGVAQAQTSGHSSGSNLEQRWGSWIEFGGRTGAGRTLGEGNLFVPVWQGTHSLGFVDIRGSFDNRSAVEGNFGGGFRHMLDNGWNLGIYGHYDLRRSSTGNTFHQATVGVEALGPWVDFRANAYIPFGQTRYSTVTGVVPGATTTTSQAVLTGTSLGIVNTTTSTLTTTTSVEQAMAGVDAEVGVRVPVFPERWKLDLKAFAGGYHFAAPGMASITGPRARLELTSNDFAGLPGVKLSGGVTWQTDAVRGDQWIASARLRIPLGAPQRSGRELTRQEERMLDPVFRDVDIVSNSRVETAQTISVTTQTEDAINTWNDLRVASVVNVDAGIGGAAVQGALDAEQAAAGADGSVVVLNGNLIYLPGLTLNASQTLLGGGTTLSLRGATTGVEVDYVASGAAGSLSGEGVNPGGGFTSLVNLGSRSVLGGLTLTQARAELNNAVVQAHNTDGAVVFGNIVRGNPGAVTSHGIVFHASSDGVAFGNVVSTGPLTNSFGLIARNSSSRIRFEGNDVGIDGPNAATVIVEGDSSATVVGNTLRANGASYAVWAHGNSVLLPGSTGNVIVGPFAGQCPSSGAPSSGTVEFTDGTACVYP